MHTLVGLDGETGALFAAVTEAAVRGGLSSFEPQNLANTAWALLPRTASVHPVRRDRGGGGAAAARLQFTPQNLARAGHAALVLLARRDRGGDGAAAGCEFNAQSLANILGVRHGQACCAGAARRDRGGGSAAAVRLQRTGPHQHGVHHIAPLRTPGSPLGRLSARDRRGGLLIIFDVTSRGSREDQMRPTVCGSVHGNAAKLSMSDRQALGFHRPPAADGHVECWCRL